MYFSAQEKLEYDTARLAYLNKWKPPIAIISQSWSNLESEESTVDLIKYLGEIGSKVQDLELDLQGIRDGNFTQTDFTEKYGSGVATNFSSERDAMNQLTPYAPYAISGQTPQDSMVNQYFANQPTSSLSSGLETSYNNAKSNINNILGIATPSQQFGYSQAPYGSYSSTNMADNPYKDYLTTRGLI